MKTAKQQIPLYDLKLPPASVNNAVKTLGSGWLSAGENVKRFESALANLLGVRYTVATNSATSALVAVLRAIGVTGRQVITTPFTFVATVEAILLAGGKPVLADIVPVTLNIDPEKVKKLINKKTAAIVSVDMAGHPCDYDKLTRIAKDAGVKLVIDASHSLGATYKSKSMALVGDAAVYSFHATKNLVCGEGGLIATRDKQLATKARLLSRHGITAIAADRKSRGATSYDVVELGFKGTLSELHAAVGRGHLTKFESNQKSRARLAERYFKKLEQYSDYLSLPILNRQAKPAWHLFVIQLELSRWTIDRDRFIREMATLGVECGVHFIPLFEFSYYKNLKRDRSSLSEATQAGQRVITLPLYPTLKLTDVDHVSACIGDLTGCFGRDR